MADYKRVETDKWYGITVETVGAYGAHAGRSARTGTKVHRVFIETVIASDPASAESPAVQDGRVKFTVGRVLRVRVACGSAKHATPSARLTAESVTCRWCRASLDRIAEIAREKE